MGGRGSGRDGNRIIVEACLKLDIYYMQRSGLFKGAWGRLTWRDVDRDEIIGSISYEINHRDDILELSYTRGEEDEKRHIKQSVYLERTRANFGGVRVWATCWCGRRCGKLYLPSGADYFKCRNCYNLTYQSCNESRLSFTKLWKRLARLRRETEG